MKVRYNVMLSPKLMEILAQAAVDLGTSRSKLIDCAIKYYCIDEGFISKYNKSSSESKIEGQLVISEVL